MTSTNLQSEKCITMQGLELWNKERAILEIGKMKSPIGYQEIRLRAWESSERLLPRPWKTRLSLEGKRGMESLLKEHGLCSILFKFQFTSVTNLRTKGMFEVYNRDQVVPSALELKYLTSRSALECAMKSAMGLGFKRKRETRYEHKDDCQIPLTYTKDSSRMKQEAAKNRDFCQMSGKGVKLGRVRQIHKTRPGSLPLYRPLQDKESAPLKLQWLNTVTEDSGHKRVERAKDQAASSRMPPARSSLVSLESSVVVVAHQVTQDGLEYLVKGARHPDISGIWTPRENMDSSLVKAYMRRQRASRCETSTQIPGGTSRRFGWGCAARYWKSLPYFRPKYVIFATLFQT